MPARPVVSRTTAKSTVMCRNCRRCLFVRSDYVTEDGQPHSVFVCGLCDGAALDYLVNAGR